MKSFVYISSYIIFKYNNRSCKTKTFDLTETSDWRPLLFQNNWTEFDFTAATYSSLFYLYLLTQ
jgi:hypothetical protein